MTELEKAKAFNLETKEALQTVFSELNYGQQKKLYENEKVKPILDRYGIEVSKE